MVTDFASSLLSFPDTDMATPTSSKKEPLPQNVRKSTPRRPEICWKQGFCSFLAYEKKINSNPYRSIHNTLFFLERKDTARKGKEHSLSFFLALNKIKKKIAVIQKVTVHSSTT